MSYYWAQFSGYPLFAESIREISPTSIDDSQKNVWIHRGKAERAIKKRDYKGAARWLQKIINDPEYMYEYRRSIVRAAPNMRVMRNIYTRLEKIDKLKEIETNLLESDNYPLLVEYDQQLGIDLSDLDVIDADLFDSEDDRVIRYIFDKLGITEITPAFIQRTGITHIFNPRLLYEYVKKYGNQEQILTESWTTLSSKQLLEVLPLVDRSIIKSMIADANAYELDYSKKLMEDYLKNLK